MTIPLNEGVALLEAITAERARPDEALARMAALRAGHSGGGAELFWEEELLTGTFVYDLVIDRPDGGAIAISLSAADEVPLPLRGLSRWRDSEIVRVDGRSLGLDDVMVLLDEIWADRKLLERIVNVALVRRELEFHPVELDDAELQDAVDRFRLAHGLLTPEATEAWLASRSLRLSGLEDLVAQDLYVEHTRHRIVGAKARAAYDADPSRFDALTVTCFPVDPANADAIADELRRGGDLLTIARRALAGQKHRGRGVVLDTFARHEIESNELAAGTIAVAKVRGAGPYVVQVEAVEPRPFDRVAKAAEQILFDEWLAARRANATIQWHWGAAERQ